MMNDKQSVKIQYENIKAGQITYLMPIESSQSLQMQQQAHKASASSMISPLTEQQTPVDAQQATHQQSITQEGKELQNEENLSDEIELYEPPRMVKKKYGNMVIFCESKYFLLSLGPNYLFFFFAYTCFTLATIYLVGLVNYSLQSETFKVFNFLFCWAQNLSYLLVALSNPGIQLPSNDSSNVQLTQANKKAQRICLKCNAVQERKTYHCRECNVCVRQYDHHCPWTSKCIGGGNLYRFYFFVCITPIYIFYYMVVFMICMANNAVEHNTNIRTHNNP